MNIGLDKIANWVTNNELLLNIDKSLPEVTASVPNRLDIKIKKQNITRVDCCKYLEVHIDCNLQLDSHIIQMVKKIKYLIFVFSKISKIMRSETLLVIYYSLFHSLITYGIIAWDGVYKNNWDSILTIQNKILKIMKSKNQEIIILPLNLTQSFFHESLGMPSLCLTRRRIYAV